MKRSLHSVTGRGESVVDFGGGKMLLLRAIVEDWKEPAEVVTVYRTSKIAKYMRPES